MKRLTSFVLAASLVLALGTSGCGKSEEAGATSGKGAEGGEAATEERKLPETEEGLVEWVAQAIGDKSLPRLTQAIGAELAADFKRDLERDPVGFWERGQAWVDNVKSGFTVAHRSDGSVKRWKALLKFGNGNSETVVFTRDGGRLLFEKL